MIQERGQGAGNSHPNDDDLSFGDPGREQGTGNSDRKTVRLEGELMRESRLEW